MTFVIILMVVVRQKFVLKSEILGNNLLLAYRHKKDNLVVVGRSNYSKHELLDLALKAFTYRIKYTWEISNWDYKLFLNADLLAPAVKG